MNFEIIPALVIFAFVSSITPGPNNLMLMASGANFGLQRTIPHMLGVGIGFSLMVILVGLGIIQVFERFPLTYDILKYCSVAYLLWLAYKIARSSEAIEEHRAGDKPMTFMQAVLFQWVNPKAWTMALTAISVYAPSKSVESIFLVALIFGLVNIPSVSSWAVLGQQMKRLLTNFNRLRVFNGTMALLLVLSLYPVISP